VAGFGVRFIDYPRGGHIELVSFAARDPSERQGDWLQGLAIRGVTRTTTLPDRFGVEPRELAQAMADCRARFSDRALPPGASAIEADVSRSFALNLAATVAAIVVLTALSLFLVIEGDAAERVLGWIGVALFGFAAPAGFLLRSRRDAPGAEAPIEIDARVEIPTTAHAAGVTEAVAGQVVEARYEYIQRHAAHQVIEAEAERAWVAEHTGVDPDAVEAVLDAHDDFLVRAGVMSRD
jgi:hypothetical protein